MHCPVEKSARGLRACAVVALAGFAALVAACDARPPAGDPGDEVLQRSADAATSETSLWPDSEVPSSYAYADSGSIEVGVKFKSSAAGQVTGIRFYKNTGNTGTHVGHLWTSSGASLGSVTFSGETDTGWQTARFSQPVTIQADTVYVASYFAPAGRYAGVSGYFSTAGRSVPPLYALKDGEQGGNGVYARSTSPAFPASTSGANNYYVDVLFLASSTTPPGTGNGLLGEYYDNIDFTGTMVSRTDAAVSFSWGTGAPASGMGPDTFSVRWTGQVLAPVTGTYTFSTLSDDGVRLWVNGTQVVNNWTDHSATTNSGQIALTGGQKYDLKMEYFEDGYDATAALSWTLPGSTSSTVIPTSNLYSTTAAPPPPPAPPPPTGSDPRWFRFYAEIPGWDMSSWGAVLQQKLGFNGFGYWAPLSSGTVGSISGSTNALMAYMPAANRNMSAYNYTYDPAKTQALENTLVSLTSGAPNDPSKIYWDGMAEFDQGGGNWAQGRPVPSSSLTPQQNYTQFRDYYLNTLGIGSIIGTPRSQRGFGFSAVSDYPWTSPWVLDWGADLVMGERIIDELSGIVPGTSFYRGAGRQAGKPWGFDFSSWRYWTSSATEYDSSDRLTGGWSASWFKRHLYLAYMAGANVLHMEPTEFLNPSGAPNPLGVVLRDFSNFALTRHPNRPPEYAPFALVIDRYSGFDPKFGQYMQGNYTWYAKIPYTPGDYMLNNVLQMAYPDHQLHGTLVAGGPQSVSEYRTRLANGEDPRPWEPMGRSRWGDVFNVLNTAAGAGAMSKHRVVMLTTHLPVDSNLRTQFQTFVNNGGVLILNAAQVGSADTVLTGAALTGQTGQSTSAVWLADGSSSTEPAYTYAKLSLQGATVVARNAEGDPLITRYAVGAGEVYLTTPTLLQDNNRTRILNVGQKLFDVLAARYAPATVQGPSVLYTLNSDAHTTTVTILNGSGSTWTGTISFPAPATTYTTREWLGDTAVSSSVSGGQVNVSASVPPYDVRIYALAW